MLSKITLNDKPAINVCIIGPVSTGKSTLLNAICLSNYAPTAMTRSTSEINIYSDVGSNENTLSQKDIYEHNSKSDTIFTNSDIGTDDFVLKENLYNVDKNRFFSCDKNIGIRVSDTPGIFDANKKVTECVMQWFKDNAKYLDIVIYLVDGDNAMNSQQQVEILEFLASTIKSEQNHARLIVLINKIDDDADSEERSALLTKARDIIIKIQTKHELRGKITADLNLVDKHTLNEYIKDKSDSFNLQIPTVQIYDNIICVSALTGYIVNYFLTHKTVEGLTIGQIKTLVASAMGLLYWKNTFTDIPLNTNKLKDEHYTKINTVMHTNIETIKSIAQNASINGLFDYLNSILCNDSDGFYMEKINRLVQDELNAYNAKQNINIEDNRHLTDILFNIYVNMNELGIEDKQTSQLSRHLINLFNSRTEWLCELTPFEDIHKNGLYVIKSLPEYLDDYFKYKTVLKTKICFNDFVVDINEPIFDILCVLIDIFIVHEDKLYSKNDIYEYVLEQLTNKYAYDSFKKSDRKICKNKSFEDYKKFMIKVNGYENIQHVAKKLLLLQICDNLLLSNSLLISLNNTKKVINTNNTTIKEYVKTDMKYLTETEANLPLADVATEGIPAINKVAKSMHDTIKCINTNYSTYNTKTTEHIDKLNECVKMINTMRTDKTDINVLTEKFDKLFVVFSKEGYTEYMKLNTLYEYHKAYLVKLDSKLAYVIKICLDAFVSKHLTDELIVKTLAIPDKEWDNIMNEYINMI